MAKEDEEKTTFITSQGIFCYSKMPFGLKNAKATYECLVDKAFQKQIGRNLEVYVDDLVIKSRTEHEIIRDVEEKFQTLKEINMKLNPKKCTFGIEEGMFLGYKVNTKGIKKCTKKSDFQWTTEAEATFKQMKQLIAELLTLTAPTEKEELIVYLATIKEAVSAVLMTEREAKQMPIYFVSRVLQVKGQILADFIVERPEDDPQDTPMEAEEELLDPWTLFMDRSSYVDGSGAGLILINLEGGEFTYALRFRFDATNNEAEYKALIAGLRIAEQTGIKNLQANVDSRLVANQVNGSYIAKELGMIQYLEKVRALASNFKKFSIKQVPRSENKRADALSKIASTSFAHLTKQVLVEEFVEKSINEAEVLAVVEEEGDTWMTPIYEYLTKERLPAEKEKARTARRKSRRMHVGTRSVVAKSIWTGYYWPTMHGDARKMIWECQDCQVHRPVPRNPQQKLTPIVSPWPFYKWGIDIVGPFPEGPGKVKFLIVAIDYFTKWIEAKPVSTITGNQIKKFVWDNIVCRFGLPGEIIADNGNLGKGIKARVDERSKDRIEEVPHVLWAHRIMIKSSNGDTPFSLTYGTEAVIPAEIGMPTLRTTKIDMVQNYKALEINLDLLEERREQAAICEAKSKARMEKYYNSKVRHTSFKPGDLVYRNNDASHDERIRGKIAHKWEVSYEVEETLGKGEKAQGLQCENPSANLKFVTLRDVHP
ncbi:reverse transcriptase domain-containing protein [Tanacetum coccineum]|uniref:Reverse transcriptase domain-containing protein n=1 Tax=Tanacetum coccineum TaxID=301880 RepID=A0ABQ5FAG0_9ASTR